MQHLSSSQLSEWEAYDQLDPIGTWRDDFRLAHIESLLVNIIGRVTATKGHTPPNTVPMDFMLDWAGELRKKNETQSVDEMKSILLGIADQQNKKVKREKEINSKPPKKRNK